MTKALEFLRSEAPDIVNLQEVYANGPDINSLGFNNQEEIQRNLEYPFNYYEPFQTFAFGTSRPSYGMLILSKYPIVKQEAIFTSLAYNGDFIYGIDDFNIRCLQHVEIRTPKGIVHDYNYHGIWVPGSKDGNTTTEAHSGVILTQMNKVKGRKILTGDF